MPIWPMAMPSQTPGTGTSTGTPPALRTTACKCMWPGTISLLAVTMPTGGKPISWSVKPSALNNERCGARATPFFALSLVILLSFFSLRDEAAHELAHLGGPDLAHAVRHDVAGARSRIEGGAHRLLDRQRLFFEAERVLEHHGRRHDGGDGIGHALAGDVRRRAVDRLVEAVLARAERRRGQHADAAGDHGSLVGEDVAEDVRS